MSESSNSNYYLYRALYMSQALQSLVIPYSQLAMLTRMVTWSSFSWRKWICLDWSWKQNPKDFNLNVFSPWCLESKTAINIFNSKCKKFIWTKRLKAMQKQNWDKGEERAFQFLFWDLHLTPLHAWPENSSGVPLLILPSPIRAEKHFGFSLLNKSSHTKPPPPQTQQA